MFESLTKDMRESGLLAEWFGQECVDGDSDGKAGSDPAAFVYRKTRHRNLWPVHENSQSWDEDSLFTAIEFFFDHVSKPTDGTIHSYNNCGMHFNTFDQASGQVAYQADVNEILDHSDLPFELGPDGIVVHRAPLGLATMYEASLVPVAGSDYERVASHAINLFRRRTASMEERRDAVKNLADALEALRPQVEAVLASKDAADLFELVNRFGIRHKNAGQKTNYDEAIFLSWMFNYLLAALHASTRLIDRASNAPDQRLDARDAR